MKQHPIFEWEPTLPVSVAKLERSYKRDSVISSCRDKDYSLTEILAARARMELIQHLLEDVLTREQFDLLMED